MKRLIALLLAVVVAASIVVAGCAPSAPTPQPTAAKPAEPTKAPAAPAAPTKAPEPTKAAAPTAAPTAPPKVDFPTKGKAITMIVPYAAGGGTDSIARFTAALLEKELGTTIQVVNKPEGGAQMGLTELAMAKPDGYTIGMTNVPSSLPTYLDPDRKATFSRKSFQPLANLIRQTFTAVVNVDSPFKTLKDLTDAAKANPEKITTATTGLLTAGHLAAVRLQKAADVKLALVHFNGAAPAVTALLGGHVQAGTIGVSETLPHVKDNKFRILAVMATEEHRAYPGVKTAEAQGVKAYADTLVGISAPAGIPKEALDLLSGALRKMAATSEYQTKMTDFGYDTKFMGPEST